MSGTNEELREELRQVAASLRAYLELHVECGSTGIPRRRGLASKPDAPLAMAAPNDAAPSASPSAPPSPAAAAPSDAAPTAPSAAPSPSPAAAASPAAPPPTVPARSPAAVPPGAFDAFAAPPPAPPAPPAAPSPSPAAAASPAAPPSPSQVPPSPVAPPRALEVIREEVRACVRCELAKSRTNTVFARGNPAAQLAFVGEAPGADEDAQGLPFVGRAGQLLDKMIRAMGLDPEADVYVCNIIKCRPPGNRKPEPAEIDACIPYLHEQLEGIAPRAIVALGNTAVSALLGTKLGITKVRGSWKLYRGKVPVMPTYHPSYLLRPSAQQVEAKRQAWEDLQAVMKELGLTPPKKT